MKNESKSLRKLIVACAALCALFVAFISYQSWGTLEYVFADIPSDMADVQWLRITLVVVRYVLAMALVATLLVFLARIWRGAAAGKLFIRGNHRWLYAMSALYLVYSLVDGNVGNIIYNGIRQIELYINEYMLITCFVLIVFAKLYSIAVEVSEEQELTI
ncbi:MAG: hypothetical protein ACI4UL_09600 [Muribaculaceae bacterium]